MREKAALCLSTGCEEFWIVDPERTAVAVQRRFGEAHLYTERDTVPLECLGAPVEVSAIFRS